MARAKWSAGKPSITVGTDGTLTASVPLLDSGVKIADITITVSGDRVFRLDFTAVQGLGPDKTIVGFEAWSNV